MIELSTFDVATIKNAIDVLSKDESEEAIKIVDALNDYIISNTEPED